MVRIHKKFAQKLKLLEKEIDLNPLKANAITMESLFENWKKNPEMLPVWKL
jgi:hypothetical protein